VALKHVRETYEKLGADDPLYAVLSFQDAKGNRWDPEAFFARGRDEITSALGFVSNLGLEPRRGRALDFGCGAGRLTQALCEEFDKVVGIDISSTMIETAERFNRHGERCRYIVNTGDRMPMLEDASIDFVYSNITLQHVPPEASTQYIAEFVRVLKPGGVALFQLPDGPYHRQGSLGERWYAFRRGPMKRFWKKIRGKPPVEIHYVNRRKVTEVVESAGGTVVDIRNDETARRKRKSLFYTVVASAP
jgi:SAM-dependent methyltransferase